MKLNLECILQKKTSQNGKEYYVLFIKDLGKYVFLSETERLLVGLLIGNFFYFFNSSIFTK